MPALFILLCNHYFLIDLQMKVFLPFFLLLCCLWADALLAQEVSIQRLSVIVKTAKSDSTKAVMLNRLGFAGNDYGLDGAAFTREALQLSFRLGIDTEKAIALLNQSQLLAEKGRYDSALLAIEQAKELYPYVDTTQSLSFFAQYYFTLGMITLPQGNEKDATLQNFLSALQLAKNTSDSYLISVCYGAVGTAYNYLRLFDKSIANNLEHLEFAMDSGDTLIVAKAYQNLSAAYLNAGNKSEYEKYNREYERLLPHLKNTYYNWLYVHNRALASAENGQYDKAISEALQSLQIAKANSLPRFKWLASYYLTGYCYYLKKQYQQSNEYMQQVAALADSLPSPEYKMYAASGMAENYFALNDFKNAYSYLSRQLSLSDSISAEKTKINANYLHIKYKIEKKDSQIQLQQSAIRQKNILNYVLAITAIGFLITLVLAWRNYTHRRKIQRQRITELETEKQLAATEAVLKGEEQERSRLAKDLHDGLGGMLSGMKHSFQNMKGNLIMTPDNAAAFERNMDMLDSSIQEMRRVAHNMMPEALVNLGLTAALDDFCSGINQSGVLQINFQAMGTAPSQLSNTVAISIYRIVQELINNSIKHSQASKALVQLSYMPGHIQITVEDNGKGMNTAQSQEHKGIGWNNVYNRIALINGSIEVLSAPDKGVSVEMEVPL